MINMDSFECDNAKFLELKYYNSQAGLNETIEYSDGIKPGYKNKS